MLSLTRTDSQDPSQHRRWFLVLALVAILGVSSLLGLYGIWFYNKTNQLVAESKVRSSEALAQSLAIAVTPDLITRDYGAIESDLRLVMSNPEVTSALALNDNGQLLAHLLRDPQLNRLVWNYSNPNAVPPDSALNTSQNENIVETWAAVGHPVRLGWIQVKVDNAGNQILLDNLHRQTSSIFILSALGFITVLAVGIFLTLNKVETTEKILNQKNKALSITALHDPLTALPNRMLLLDRLSIALASHDRSEGLLVICFVDLDGFKSINDQFGHDAGDTVLKSISNRLLGGVRENDTVARIGGDEFILLINHVDHAHQASETLLRLLAQLQEPIIYGKRKLRIGASIGYTIYPEDSTKPDELIEHADIAMYTAKRSGKNQICYFGDLPTQKNQT